MAEVYLLQKINGKSSIHSDKKNYNVSSDYETAGSPQETKVVLSNTVTYNFAGIMF